MLTPTVYRYINQDFLIEERPNFIIIVNVLLLEKVIQSKTDLNRQISTHNFD